MQRMAEREADLGSPNLTLQKKRRCLFLPEQALVKHVLCLLWQKMSFLARTGSCEARSRPALADQSQMSRYRKHRQEFLEGSRVLRESMRQVQRQRETYKKIRICVGREGEKERRKER